MHIINKQEFLNMPMGTAYLEYEPEIFSELRFKCESLFESNDFTYQTTNYHTYLTEYSAKLDMDCASRDGQYDDDMQYAILEKQEIEQLIDKLNYSKSILEV